MKKNSFVAMLMGTVSVVLFALGMCMALIPEWGAFRPGIICGCVGLLLGLITVIVWRKMEHKAPIRFSVKNVFAAVYPNFKFYSKQRRNTMPDAPTSCTEKVFRLHIF